MLGDLKRKITLVAFMIFTILSFGLSYAIPSAFAVAGDFIDVFASGSGLDFPIGLVFGPDGNLYVSSANTDEVLRYNGTTGAFIDAFVSAGSGGLDAPNGLVFGPDGNLYVTSVDTDEVLRYNGASGAFIDAFVSAGSGGLAAPIGPVFGPDGNLYVSSGDTNQVLRYEGFPPQAIGGTFIPIDNSALILAGVQSISMWMIPVILAGIGIGIFVIKRRN